MSGRVIPRFRLLIRNTPHSRLEKSSRLFSVCAEHGTKRTVADEKV